MADVKKVIQRIYEFNLKDCSLEDGNEIIASDRGNEFVSAFSLRDFDKGIIVTPSGYRSGLVYKSTNGGEIYNNPEWKPEIVNFNFNLFGLKKNAFYRVTVTGRDTHAYNRLIDLTDDRLLEVSTSDDIVILSKDFTKVSDNISVDGIFRARTTEENIYFRLGKIYITNIAIDEIELLSDENEEQEEGFVSEFQNKMELATYALFTPTTAKAAGRFAEVQRISGKGISLYFDSSDCSYVLERDNKEDILAAPFTNADMLIDFNFNKAPGAVYRITEISPEVSPNTLKQGYLKFQFIGADGKPIKYEKEHARFAIIIHKIS